MKRHFDAHSSRVSRFDLESQQGGKGTVLERRQRGKFFSGELLHGSIVGHYPFLRQPQGIQLLKNDTFSTAAARRAPHHLSRAPR